VLVYKYPPPIEDLKVLSEFPVADVKNGFTSSINLWKSDG
jgi:hypothetical protein